MGNSDGSYFFRRTYWDELVNFPKSDYSDPLFNWRVPFGPTDIEFFTSSELGDNYTNNIFVGDITRGNLHFKINENRDGIKLDTNQQQLVYPTL